MSNDLRERVEERQGRTVSSRVRARILWPALGFPAVVAPRQRPSARLWTDGDATRCITLLVLSNRKSMSKKEAADHLRFVSWNERSRRHLAAGREGSFDEVDLDVRDLALDGNRTSRLSLPGAKDRLGELVAFGGNADGDRSIVVTLANFVRDFYRKQGLKYLHEIRVYERATGRLNDGQYNLFWNNRSASEKAPSDELRLLLDRFAKPRRKSVPWLWRQVSRYLMKEYEYEYGVAHEPYASKLSMRRPRTEILHPLFVRRAFPKKLKIGHVTDAHVHVRADVYEQNLKQAGSRVPFNNWNKSFSRVYEDVKDDNDLLLLTGDLIDYGRGHWGVGAPRKLGEDRLYQVDRNWFLFYYLLAGGDAYTKPTYTILGNHDWRLNPYPPFAPGAPKFPSLVLDNRTRSTQEKKRLLDEAHGPGSRRRFSYFGATEEEFYKSLGRSGDLAKAVARFLTHRRTMDVPHTPAHTTVESVAWYLLLINPFLDYSFSLPGGYQALMIDWAENEDLLFPVVDGGKKWPYMVWQAEGRATGPGPKARDSLSKLQKRLVKFFLETPGRAKIIGIHAPLIGPYPHWSDHDLRMSKKTYPGRKRRGPWGFGVRANGKTVAWNGHPIFAIRPREGADGMEASYGSLGKEKARAWLIREMAKPGSGVRLVFSGHIHRNGLFVAYSPNRQKMPEFSKELLARGVVGPAVASAPPPAVTVTPEGGRGPLYVNTTSAGPRGTFSPGSNQGKSWVKPGFAEVALGRNGTVHSAKFRSI